MMPNPMQGAGPGGPGGSVPVGPGPATGGPDQPTPDTMKQQLVMLLKKAKEMAEKNGVNWDDVVSEVQGKQVNADVPLPRPPKAGP